ncbi:hypothetical protein K435DRAFT_889881 [Dendrothele bispora CBS 962.96]|uniref:ABM domain-containing protein n=1 Tax=Dendrothele bispora (strain CBS 962.96) TaxID=1314807 RepID=A0A4S8M514_DENBC|nr:hypothetical protein K435DRAFT_889881 [Dendrothele bispora CBS 962.96]
MLRSILVAACFFLTISKVDARTPPVISQYPTSSVCQTTAAYTTSTSAVPPKPSFCTASAGDNSTAIVDDFDFSNIPERTSSGRLMLVAHVKVTPGKEALYEQLIKQVEICRNAGGEPGTLTYRVARKVDENANPTGEYISIEEYTGKPAFLDHLRTPPAIQFLKEVENGLFLSNVIDVVDDPHAFHAYVRYVLAVFLSPWPKAEMPALVMHIEVLAHAYR